MPPPGSACPRPSPPRPVVPEATRSPITGELLPPILPADFPSTNPEILHRICTPYAADGFEEIFQKYPILREENPHLIHKLRHGFPMGVFPELTETVIHPNNPSVMQHAEFVDAYFAEEVEAGRMSGPFTQEEVEGILGGPFVCSPLSIDEKDIDGSFEKKLRMCINLSKGNKNSPSANSYADKEDFPTTYDPAAAVGDLVSPRSSHLSPSQFYRDVDALAPSWSGLIHPLAVLFSARHWLHARVCCSRGLHAQDRMSNE